MYHRFCTTAQVMYHRAGYVPPRRLRTTAQVTYHQVRKKKLHRLLDCSSSLGPIFVWSVATANIVSATCSKKHSLNAVISANASCNKLRPLEIRLGVVLPIVISSLRSDLASMVHFQDPANFPLSMVGS